MNILISGASTGIGRATAIHMARKDHMVWAGVRSQKSFEEISKLNVKGLSPVFLDVCDEKSIVNCIGAVKKSAGMLHALVNNAGIAIGGPVEGVPMGDWRRQFDTNFFGQIRVIQEALPLLRETKGRIVNISSISGRLASPYLAPYSASKFALEALSDSLRREVAPMGIKVVLIEPGPIDTPIWEKSRTDGLNRNATYSETVNEVYGASLKRFLTEIEKTTKNAAPVALVVEAIEHGLTSSRPKTRYPVGKGISLAATLASTLPDRILDRILRFRI